MILTNNTKFIIDVGISYLKLRKSIEKLDLNVNDFTGLLITHSHSDHIKGLASIIKNTKLNVYIPLKMYAELSNIVPDDRVVVLDEVNKFSDLEIELLPTSHDSGCSVGYLFTSRGKTLVYITDTGYINRKILEKIVNKNLYLIESNHDEVMLMEGPYPTFLKERVCSDYGHLSNKTTARYLKKIVGPDTKTILLAHISEKNNTYEKVLEEIDSIKLDENIDVMIAEQNEESPLINV